MKLLDRLFRRKTNRVEVMRTEWIQLFFLLDTSVVPPLRLPLQDDELKNVTVEKGLGGSAVTATFSLTNEAVGDLILSAERLECAWRGEVFNRSRIIRRSWDRLSNTMTLYAESPEL